MESAQKKTHSSVKSQHEESFKIFLGYEKVAAAPITSCIQIAEIVVCIMQNCSVIQIFFFPSLVYTNSLEMAII